MYFSIVLVRDQEPVTVRGQSTRERRSQVVDDALAVGDETVGVADEAFVVDAVPVLVRDKTHLVGNPAGITVHDTTAIFDARADGSHIALR